MSLWLGVLGGQITKGPPPAGYTLGSNGKYYKLYPLSRDRQTAESIINADGGWLFVPTSSADKTAVLNATFQWTTLNFWVGMTFDELGDAQQRIKSTNHPLNGQVFTYQDWAMGWPAAGLGWPWVYRSASLNGYEQRPDQFDNYRFIGEWY